MVDDLETRCDDYPGINLTLAVRDGILKHTSLKRDGILIAFPEGHFENIDLNKVSCTFEGQVVALADEIA